MGWPLRSGAKFREFGGSFIYPMGEDMVTIGMVVGLDYRDAALSVHDLLQELKTHPRIRPILEGGERVAWGAKTIPEGGFVALPKRFWAPGLLIAGDGAGLVNVPALKGIHYAVESGRLAAEAAWKTVAPEGRGGWLPGYDESLRSSFVLHDLRRVRNMRQAFGAGFWRGSAMAGLATVTAGKFPPGDRPTERDAEHEIFRTDRASSYPASDGTLTFDKLSSVFLSGNRTRDDQPSHIRVATRVPAELAELWTRMCPAQVYEVGPGGRGRDGGARREPVQLRPVRRDHRERRPPHPARRRLGARVHAHLNHAARYEARELGLGGRGESLPNCSRSRPMASGSRGSSIPAVARKLVQGHSPGCSSSPARAGFHST